MPYAAPPAALALMVSLLAVSLAPAPAAAAPPEPAPTGLGGLIRDRLDDMTLIGGGSTQQYTHVITTVDNTTRITLSETRTAKTAKLGVADRPVRVDAVCTWRINTRLEAVYDPASRALQGVTGRPDAALSCDGKAVRPVRQDGTLTHRLNDATDATIGTQRCASAKGCASASVTGPYRCTGTTCAGRHQLVLTHTWKLPAPYVWQDAPDWCRVSDRGATLSCATPARVVTIPERRGRVSVSSSRPAA